MDCTCILNKEECDCKNKNEKYVEAPTKSIFDAWTKSLEEQEQPQACNIQDEDCENCGS